MFEFQKLLVYQKSIDFHFFLHNLVNSCKVESTTRNQLFRASLSIPLNIAEGSGRFSKADRKNFFTIARSSVFECVAILDILKEDYATFRDQYITLLQKSDELSRMLYTMIKNLSG